MSPPYSLTGTDPKTDKSSPTGALPHHPARRGLRAAGIKPVAAGTDAEGRNEDVESIRAASNVALPDAIINPWCFQAAIAPHIAAAEGGVTIDFAPIAAACASARQQSDLLIVEGVGGFRVPLGVDRDSADLAVALGLPVILVVGLRLGCINHALLTAESIAARGLKLAGWVANCIDPAMPRLAENIAALNQRLGAPLLGIVPHLPGSNSADAARHLKLPEIRGI